MLEFSYRPQIFDGFYRGERRSNGTLIGWDRHVNVLLLLNSDLWKQQSRGDIKNNIHEEWNKNYFRSSLYLIYFILELLSELNSFTYNLLDVSICDALRDFVSVNIWHLYDRSNACECMLTLFSTSLPLLSVCMS